LAVSGSDPMAAADPTVTNGTFDGIGDFRHDSWVSPSWRLIGRAENTAPDAPGQEITNTAPAPDTEPSASGITAAMPRRAPECARETREPEGTTNHT
jgi:hypothetical protein